MENTSAILFTTVDPSVFFQKGALGEFVALSHKATPIDADYILIEDSADSNRKKYVTRAELFISPITSDLLLSTGVIKGSGTAPQLSIQDSSSHIMGLFEYGTSTGIPSTFSTINSSTNFISGRVFNAIWNDIAEQVPSDGTLKPGDLAFVDIMHHSFRVTAWQGVADAFVGVVSKNPGFIVGVNKKYKHPVFVGMKGQLDVNVQDTKKFHVGRRLYFTRDGILKDSIEMFQHEIEYSKLIGVIIEKHEHHLKIFV